MQSDSNTQTTGRATPEQEAISRSIAAERAFVSGHVSLLIIRNRASQDVAYLVVAHCAEDGLRALVREGVEGWTLANTTTLSVQRNVDMEEGLVTPIPLRTSAGVHRIGVSPSRKRKKQKKLERANG